jgi:5-amino-6-(5-phosphoribosylamino)uracil reductase
VKLRNVGAKDLRNWEERFAAFAERKMREALAAKLPPYQTVIDRHPASFLAIGNEWSERLFDGHFYLSALPDTKRPACSLVFVQSKDGNTGARNPSTLGGGMTDAHLIYEGLSRVAADAVMAGAETIRGGQIVFSVWHPELVGLRESIGRARHPIQIVATLRGLDINEALIFNVPEIPVVLLTVAACTSLMGESLAARPWITPVVMERPQDLAVAFEDLRKLGIERVSAVGGRKIATQLIDAGLVQDVYLTTSPVAGGEPHTPMYPKPLNGTVVLKKQGTGDESGVRFEHYRLT